MRFESSFRWSLQGNMSSISRLREEESDALLSYASRPRVTIQRPDQPDEYRPTCVHSPCRSHRMPHTRTGYIYQRAPHSPRAKKLKKNGGAENGGVGIASSRAFGKCTCDVLFIVEYAYVELIGIQSKGVCCVLPYGTAVSRSW